MNEMSSAMNISRIENATARNRIYALLAMGFSYPDEEGFARTADGAYAEALVQALNICAPDLTEFFRADVAPGLRADVSHKDMEAAYISSFETNMPVPSVSLYEGSHHLQGNKPELLLELKSFYRAFGLTMAESENDLEDSLTAELEFMQFLTAKQAQAEDGTLEKAPYLRAQKDFLERHLAAWLPPLQAEGASKLTSPFYRALIALADQFVLLDVMAVERDVASLDM
ncbi:MAG: molecular chaperone TorD family protein [Rhodocyclales bacterium]|jgi:DMSO reductase family type II enzyme chaperone|nr:molecular chaperone TorD family protein [Rhodocyclales bacterium]